MDDGIAGDGAKSYAFEISVASADANHDQLSVPPVPATNEHLDWVLLPFTTYVQTDGVTVVGATNENGILPIPLQNDLNPGYTQYAAWIGLDRQWKIYGKANDNRCADWTVGDNIQGHGGSVGHADQVTVEFLLVNGGTICNGQNAVICVEQ